MIDGLRSHIPRQRESMAVHLDIDRSSDRLMDKHWSKIRYPGQRESMAVHLDLDRG
jgi:hypothetical protein